MAGRPMAPRTYPSALPLLLLSLAPPQRVSCSVHSIMFRPGVKIKNWATFVVPPSAGQLGLGLPEEVHPPGKAPVAPGDFYDAASMILPSMILPDSSATASDRGRIMAGRMMIHTAGHRVAPERACSAVYSRSC